MTLLLVDGYNVLHARGRYQQLAAESLDAARARLVDDLASLSAGDLDIAVVFDGAGNPMADGTPLDVGGVSVIFSPPGVEADAVVERMAREGSQSEDVVVITSDLQTARAVAGDRVRVVSATGFLDQLESAETDRRGYTSRGRRKSTIESRLAPEVRATFLRFLRR